jgi:hypothetical protein
MTLPRYQLLVREPTGLGLRLSSAAFVCNPAMTHAANGNKSVKLPKPSLSTLSSIFTLNSSAYFDIR